MSEQVDMDPSTTAAGGRGPIAFFARSPVAVNMIMLLLLGGGIGAALLLPVQSFPDFDPRMIQVTTPYPGATPEEVEDGITRRVEERIRDISGIRQVSSVAHENVGVVIAELATFADADAVKADVQTAVNSLENFPPQFAERPQVGFPTILRNVATLAVTSETASEADLRGAAEIVRDRLLALPTVSHVDLFGARDYEVSIEVSEAALLRNDLTVEEVANAVRLSSVNQASGELRTDAGGLLIRTNAKRQEANEFGDIPVLTRPDGSILRLRDVARIRDGFVDAELISRIDGRPAVFLRVRESDAGDPQILPAAAAAMTAAAGIALPAGIELVAWEDGSQRTRVRIEAMVGNAVLGCVLVFLLLSLVMDLRLAMWIMAGIPISFLGALLLFEPLGLTINSTTLFALVLATGIVVDDAIVVGESVAAQHESGNTGLAGAIAGARAVVGPVVTGVVTTMVAFAPLAFVPGVVGQILTAVPLVVVCVLAVSLFEAFMILPAHLAHGRAWSRSPLADVQSRGRNWLANLRDNLVVRAIMAALLRPWITVLAAIAFLLVAAALVATSTVRFVLFDPPADVDRLSVQMAFPVGTPFDVTQAAVDRVVGAAYATDESTEGESFRSIAVIVGGEFAPGVDSFDVGHRDSEYATHLASVVAVMNDPSQRGLTATELVHAWRTNVGEVQGAESVTYGASSVAIVPEVGYVLTHPDPDVLEQAAEAFEQAVAREDAVYGTTKSLAPGKRQFQIALNSMGTATGLTARDVAGQLRSRFHGVEVQRNQRGRDETKVVVRYPDEERLRLADLLDERIAVRSDPPWAGLGTSPLTVGVPLALIAEVKETRGLASIERLDGVRSAQIDARVDAVQRAPNEVNATLEADVLPSLQTRYPGLGYVRAGQAGLQDRIAEVLALLIPLAALVIYGLIAVQLKSYALPLIVVAAIPFASAGAVFGHLLLGYDLSAYSVFGVIAIGGVVVNDVLVLLDRYNRIRRESGMRADVAMVAAATRHRFRAILLTTVTTLMALLPTLYSKNPDVIPLIPLVVSLVSGLAFANAILLFFVPALLALLEGAQERFAPPPADEDAAQATQV